MTLDEIIARFEMARAEGFAAGIEAAADCVEQADSLGFSRLECAADIRALIPAAPEPKP